MTAQTILPANTLSTGGFQVDNSAMFNSGDSAYMTKEQGTATVATKYTLSMWIKRSKLGAEMNLIGVSSGNTIELIKFNADNSLRWYNRDASSNAAENTAAGVFRDISAWYHFVFVYDSTQSGAANQRKFYLNGVNQTWASANAVQANAVPGLNLDGADVNIGAESSPSLYFGGYMAEINFIDGQRLTADSFGESDEDSGIWKPIDASGLTFGNNGFYLDFKASGNLGNDANGGTDFAETNFAARDQATDTCTNNFCTINPLYNATSSPFTFTQGNCEVEQNTTNWRTAAGTMGVSSGKWYFEAKGGQGTNGYTHYGWSSDSWLTEKGIGSMNEPTTNHNGPAVTYYGYNGNNYYSTSSSTGSNASYGATWDNDNTIGCFLDLDNNKAYWSKDGALQNSGTGYSIESGFTWFPVVGGYDMDAGGESVKLNFGGCPATTISSGNTDGEYGNFEYTTTITGDSVSKTFKALCSKNLAEYG